VPHARLRPYRFAGFAVAVALLVAVAVATVWGIRGFALSTDRVEQSYRVLAAVEATESAVRAAESSARGYRLTESVQQHAEYLAALPHVHEQTGRLLLLTADNPLQLRRAGDLKQRVRERLDDIEYLMRLQERQGAEAAREASLLGTGSMRMSRITAQADEIRETERFLLDQRKAASHMRSNLLIGFVVLGIVLPMALLGVLLFGLIRENSRSRVLEREARNAMRELEGLLVQRDRLSEQRRWLGHYAGLLQSCHDVGEAMALTADVITRLLPRVGGRCYSLRPSQNLAETSVRFGSEAIASLDMLQPEQCWALRRGQPHSTGAEQGRVRCAHVDQDAAPGEVWTACVPLIAQGTSLGLLHVNAHLRDVDAEADTAAIEAIAEQLGLAISNLQLRETLRSQSIRDPLTGLFNRRYLEENLARELQRCERRGLPLSLLMLDVDHFKRFNDQHGHAAGDALLARIGHTLIALTRNEDIACRYGGEEFTVVLPEADAQTARRRADEILAAIGATTIIHLRQSLGPSTASIGIATFPADGDHPERLLAVADAGLYRAKAAGRNRVGEPAAG